VKLVNIKNPVRSSWLIEQGYRLDASPFLSGAYEARKLLESLSAPREPLYKLTQGHDGGIYNGPKFRRVYVTDPEHGVPFLGSTDMLEADFSWLPLLRKRDADKLPFLEVTPGTTLISCSGTVGRIAYTRSDMKGFWSSQHVMKVCPNPSQIPPGYLNAFLQSRFGVPIIASAAYGAIIQHIEPHHIADLPVPRLGQDVEGRIHQLIEQAAELRAKFQAGIRAATRDLFVSAGLPELADYSWHKQPRDLGFHVDRVTPTTLRAMNFSPRAARILDALRSSPHQTLGEICKGGTLRTGTRFKRIDAEATHGVRLVGQRQAFWVRPEGRWISAEKAPLDIILKDETVLIAAHGTLGENEVYARSVLITGNLLRNAYSQDFVRVLSGSSAFPGAYLFAFLRSEAAFRVLRSISVGGKQQEYHNLLLSEIPVPVCTAADRERIAEIVRQAYRDRDEADRREDQALDLLDQAVREAAV